MHPRLYLVAARAAFETDAAWLDALERVARPAARRGGTIAAIQVRLHDAAGERAADFTRLRRDRDERLAADALRRIRGVDGGGALRVLLNHPSLDAERAGYDGVHWREDAIPTQPLAAESPRFASASGHSGAALRRAEAAGARLVLFGPIWGSSWKESRPVGLAALRAIAGATSLPVFAIGGVTPDRARACLEQGAAGIAAVSAVFHLENPGAALDAFAAALGAASQDGSPSTQGSARDVTGAPESE
jgi:thiamine monophosphate synthase